MSKNKERVYIAWQYFGIIIGCWAVLKSPELVR